MINTPRHSHAVHNAQLFSVTVLFAITVLASTACNDVTPVGPGDPDPVDTATYDLAFEQNAFPLTAWELRVRRTGATTHDLLFGQLIYGIEPSVSADGRSVVYQGSNDDQDNSDLFIVRPNQTPQRVPLPIGDIEFAPALSPDASQIAYILLGIDGNTELWTAEVNGNNRRRLSTVASGVAYANSTPAWSPNGQRLAWAFGAPGAMRINIIHVDGSGRETVSAGVTGGSDIDVDWSPDGKQLVYVRSPSPSVSDLVVLTIATGQERALGLARRNRQPVWARDGKSIVFSSTMANDVSTTELYSVRPDGTELTRLTHDDVSQRHPIWIKR